MTIVPHEDAVNFQFDIVTVIKNSEISKENLKEFSTTVKDHIVRDCTGDSLAITGMRGMLKVHWHADDPKEVLKVLEQYGEILSHEIEDMKEQYEEFKAKQNQE